MNIALYYFWNKLLLLLPDNPFNKFKTTNYETFKKQSHVK